MSRETIDYRIYSSHLSEDSDVDVIGLANAYSEELEELLEDAGFEADITIHHNVSGAGSGWKNQTDFSREDQIEIEDIIERAWDVASGWGRVDPLPKVEASNPRPTNCVDDVERGRDVDIVLTVGSEKVEGECTLILDHQDNWSSWGERDMWLSGNLVQAIGRLEKTFSDEFGRSVCRAIAATAAKAIEEEE